jgi:hypothetical protein
VRAARRGASSSDRPDRRRGRGRTPADSRRGRSARTGASPRVLAGNPQGRGHARGLVRLMGCGKGWIASPRFGPRVRRGLSLRALTLSAPWWEPVYPTSDGRGNPASLPPVVCCLEFRTFRSATTPGPAGRGPRIRVRRVGWRRPRDGARTPSRAGGEQAVIDEQRPPRWGTRAASRSSHSSGARRSGVRGAGGHRGSLGLTHRRVIPTARVSLAAAAARRSQPTSRL